MAEVEIRLSIDPSSGKKTVTVAYRSDEDALPMEHEQEHRRIVQSLLNKGIIDASEQDSVVVERVSETAVGESATESVPTKQGLEQEQ